MEKDKAFWVAIHSISLFWKKRTTFGCVKNLTVHIRGLFNLLSHKQRVKGQVKVQDVL